VLRFPAAWDKYLPFPLISPILSLLSLLFCSYALVLLCCSEIRKYYFQVGSPEDINWKMMKARNHFFYFLIIYSILKITDSAAAAVSFDVTGAVGSYVITPNLYQCDPSTNSYVDYGGMASSSESFGMAYDSIRSISLTQVNIKSYKFPIGTIDILFVLLLAQSIIHRLVM
jgi:hypothetical protein